MVSCPSGIQDQWLTSPGRASPSPLWQHRHGPRQRMGLCPAEHRALGERRQVGTAVRSPHHECGHHTSTAWHFPWIFSESIFLWFSQAVYECFEKFRVIIEGQSTRISGESMQIHCWFLFVFGQTSSKVWWCSAMRKPCGRMPTGRLFCGTRAGGIWWYRRNPKCCSTRWAFVGPWLMQSFGLDQALWGWDYCLVLDGEHDDDVLILEITVFFQELGDVQLGHSPTPEPYLLRFLMPIMPFLAMNLQIFADNLVLPPYHIIIILSYNYYFPIKCYKLSAEGQKTTKEAFDEEQEKLASLLQSLLSEPKETEKDGKRPSKARSPSSKSSKSAGSSQKHRSRSSSRSRSPRSVDGSARSGTQGNSAKPQKRPINALFFHDERISGAWVGLGLLDFNTFCKYYENRVIKCMNFRPGLKSDEFWPWFEFGP